MDDLIEHCIRELAFDGDLGSLSPLSVFPTFIRASVRLPFSVLFQQTAF